MEELNEALSTWQYAKANNIDPLDPTTWNDEYRKRQLYLAGISDPVEMQIKQLKEWLDSVSENSKGEKPE